MENSAKRSVFIVREGPTERLNKFYHYGLLGLELAIIYKDSHNELHFGHEEK